MLILTRKIGEKVIIGDDMKIRVLRVEGGRVKIGIEAPLSVNIVREELLVRGRKNQSIKAAD